jgi:CheY-like chemotaxis protein/HPt (histidine-containing phosphotransfer) domain-containing protein
MGGQVQVQSILGQGSTFSFSAWFQQACGAVASDCNREAVVGQGACGATQHLRILLAEDNEVNQRISTAMLERQGHQVQAVCNGHEVLKALASAPPFDVVLMDVQMPDMDGLETTALLRRQEAGSGRHVPVIALTAHAMQGDRERCLAVGMDGYVTKPITGATLARAIADVLGRPAAVPPAEDGVHQDDTPGADEAPAIDTATLLRRLGGNRELLTQVLQMFRTDCSRRLNELEAAAASHDWTWLCREAHTLKGSLGTLCAGGAYAAALRLETLARNQSSGDLADAFRGLTREIDKLQLVLAKLDAQPVPPDRDPRR